MRVADEEVGELGFQRVVELDCAGRKVFVSFDNVDEGLSAFRFSPDEILVSVPTPAPQAAS